MTKQLSVEEGNKLIAEFMGLKCIERELHEFGTIKMWVNENDQMVCDFSEIPYHVSWDWLMPVVEKIEGLGYRFKQCRRRVVIEYDHQPSVEKDFTVLMVKADTKILAAWQACEKFIQWYQSKNQL